MWIRIQCRIFTHPGSRIKRQKGTGSRLFVTSFIYRSGRGERSGRLLAQPLCGSVRLPLPLHLRHVRAGRPAAEPLLLHLGDGAGHQSCSGVHHSRRHLGRAVLCLSLLPDPQGELGFLCQCVLEWIRIGFQCRSGFGAISGCQCLIRIRGFDDHKLYNSTVELKKSHIFFIKNSTKFFTKPQLKTSKLLYLRSLPALRTL